MPEKTTSKKAVKKVAVKKAVKKVAAKKVAKKVSTKKATAVKTPTTHIMAHVDVGFGNTLYIRGEGAGLSWEKGIALQNLTPYEWAFTCTPAKGSVTFKFLINDTIWAEGENLTVAVGEKSISSPTFF